MAGLRSRYHQRMNAPIRSNRLTEAKPAPGQTDASALRFIHLRVHSAYSLLEGALPIPRLDPVQIAMMGTPTFESNTFGLDFAENEFPEDFTLFGWQSRHIVLWLRFAPVDIIYTFDGVTGLELRTVYESYRATEGFQGFMIRNTIPGNAAWYQLIAYR